MDIDYNKVVETLLRSDKWEERAEAARNIGLHSDGRATHILTKVLKREKDSVVISRIIEAMGRIRDPKATMSIIEILKQETIKQNPDRKLLFVIIESLMKIGDKRALEDLGILHNSCDANIQELTEQAFECIDPNWKQNI